MKIKILLKKVLLILALVYFVGLATLELLGVGEPYLNSHLVFATMLQWLSLLCLVFLIRTAASSEDFHNKFFNYIFTGCLWLKLYVVNFTLISGGVQNHGYSNLEYVYMTCTLIMAFVLARSWVGAIFKNHENTSTSTSIATTEFHTD
jgi:hypothetical protein